MSSYVLRVVWMVFLGALINPSQECQSGPYPCILNGSDGHITSPDYPLFYPDNTNISWLIHVGHDYSIKLEFDDNFGIELTPNCQSDFLVVYDGSDTGSPLIGKYCGSDKPPNLYSSSSTLFVAFISNNEDQSSGFFANYTALKTASNCSAQQTNEENTNIILSDISGNLLANFKNDFNKTSPTRCLWRLTAPQGLGIKITIKALDFVKDISCLRSSFDVYKGYVVQEGKLVHRYCRIKVDTPVVRYIPERTALLRLDIDELSTWSGSNAFAVTYEFLKKEENICSTLNNQQENNNIKLSGHNGNFTIHTNAGNPDQSLQCVWQITAPNGYQVRLSFLDFTLENNCIKSYVEIFDGEISKGKFCGPSTPWVVFSTRGYLVVKFTSSGNTDVSRRLVGVYEAVTKATERCSTINTKEMNSNIQLKGENGVVMTPNYPSKYPPDFTCIWIITVPSQYRIRLRFVAFKVEDHGCTYDFVEIRDGNSSASPIKTDGKLCGSKVPHDFYSTSNYMRILFLSDFSEQMTGFQAFYSVVTPEPGKCSPVNTDQENSNIYITDVPGLLTSPNYPQTYPPSIRCTWHLTVASSSRIHVHFYDFKVQSPCSLGFLEGFDGNWSSSTSLGRYCGSSLPSDMFSTGNSITLVFQSSKFASYRGFKLTYSILKLGPGICSKGNSPLINDKLLINNISGYISSPNFPLPYTRGMQCTWHARAPPGYHVELNFTSIHFPLPCVQDYLEVRDGSSSFSPLKGRFCTSPNTFRIYSSGRDLLLRFVSQHTVSEAYQGFYVHYRMIKAGNCSKDFDQSWNTNLNFGQNMSGSLTSPGYPTSYPLDMQCTWKITVPFGYRVQLQFDYLILREPCKYNYIEIRDGFYSFSKVLGTFCTEESTRVVSTDRRMLVHFQSGKWNSHSLGFEARFSALSSGKTSSGSLTTGAITISLIVFAGFVLLTLAFILMYWLLKKRYRRRPSSRPRDHDLAVISPMPVPPLDDIPDCLIAEDRPPSYAEAVNEDNEEQPSVRETEPADSSAVDTFEGRSREAERGLDNEGFTSDPPPYESLYGVDPT